MIEFRSEAGRSAEQKTGDNRPLSGVEPRVHGNESLWLAGILKLFMALCFWIVAMLPASDFYTLGETWSQVFTLLPAIVIASITAELVSELIDTEVYHWWWKTREGYPQWTRVAVSNAVSLPIDSLVTIGASLQKT